MRKIDCIIYSKNRACQLDLLLRSIADNFVNIGRVFVLYAYSDLNFEWAYDKCFSKWLDFIIAVDQTNFEQDVRTIIAQMDGYYFGLCDDDVIIRKTDCSEALEQLRDPQINAVSLKAGLNIAGNYPNFVYPLPTFLENGSILKWEWRNSNRNADWGYPTCINSYIFEKSYFQSLIGLFSFSCPTNLEGGLNTLKFKMMRPYMVSLPEQKILNIPANRIQSISDNVSGVTLAYSAQELNNKYLSGQRIATSNIYDRKTTMGNEEVEFLFEEEK